MQVVPPERSEGRKSFRLHHRFEKVSGRTGVPEPKVPRTRHGAGTWCPRPTVSPGTGWERSTAGVASAHPGRSTAGRQLTRQHFLLKRSEPHNSMAALGDNGNPAERERNSRMCVTNGNIGLCGVQHTGRQWEKQMEEDSQRAKLETP